MLDRDDIRLLQGPPRRQWIGWIMWAIHLVWSIRDWLSLIDIGVSFGFVVLAMAMRRGLKRRSLWVTPDEVIVSNTEEMHVIPMDGAKAKIVDSERGVLANRPNFDNTKVAQMRLFVFPGDREQPTVAVEAGLGLRPSRLRQLEAELQAAILDAAV